MIRVWRNVQHELEMLAYVFWHWKQAQIPPEEYERRQRLFHAALGEAPPPGYVRSFSAGVSGVPWAGVPWAGVPWAGVPWAGVPWAGVPWAGDGDDSYEDWYLIDDFQALGSLNDAAVSAGRAAAHDVAAEVARGGTAGVYRLRCGAAIGAPTRAYWFGKPSGMSYPTLFAELTPVVERTGAALWGRQLTLGPAQEFCLHALEPVSLPAVFEVMAVTLRPIWPLSNPD